MPTYLYYLLAKSGGNNSKQRQNSNIQLFKRAPATLTPLT